MKILISPESLQEAKEILTADMDILDIKRPIEGCLGAQFPWIIREIVEESKKHNRMCSATIGDLPYKPGTCAQAALGTAYTGVTYIKAGIHGTNKLEEAFEMLDAIVKAIDMVDSKITKVASGYADFKRFNGLHYRDLVTAAEKSNCDLVMVDTSIKDGKSLFDNLTIEEIEDFVALGHNAKLKVALAGSLKIRHIEKLTNLKHKPDIIGVRSACCENEDRRKPMRLDLVNSFTEKVRKLTNL